MVHGSNTSNENSEEHLGLSLLKHLTKYDGVSLSSAATEQYKIPSQQSLTDMLNTAQNELEKCLIINLIEAFIKDKKNLIMQNQMHNYAAHVQTRQMKKNT